MVAYCRAMAEARVQFPLGALDDPVSRIGTTIGVWESLEIRVPWEHEIVGSNPTAPTTNRGR